MKQVFEEEVLGFKGSEVYRESFYEEEVSALDDLLAIKEDEDETERSLLPPAEEELPPQPVVPQSPSAAAHATPYSATFVSPTSNKDQKKWTPPAAPQEIQAPRPPSSPEEQVRNSVSIPEVFDSSAATANAAQAKLVSNLLLSARGWVFGSPLKTIMRSVDPI